MSVLLLGLVHLCRNRLFSQVNVYNQEYNGVRNYSLLVRNLPKSITAAQITDYFQTLAKCKVVKVNLVYQLEDYQKLQEQKARLNKSIFSFRNRVESLQSSLKTERLRESSKCQKLEQSLE